MKSFSNETLNFFLQKVLFLPHFGSCQNRVSSCEFRRTNSLGNFVIEEL